MSTVSPQSSFQPGQWRVVDANKGTIGRMKAGENELEIYKVEHVTSSMGAVKVDAINSLVKTLNNDPVRGKKLSDTQPLAMMLDDVKYKIQFNPVKAVAEKIIHSPLEQYKPVPLPRPPVTQPFEAKQFVKLFELMDRRTGRIVNDESEVDKVIGKRLTSTNKDIREEMSSALAEAKKSGEGKFTGYTISRKKPQAMPSSAQTTSKAPPIPERTYLDRKKK